MGCCCSYNDVPDEILPDPVEPSRFFLKSAGFFSSNYHVLRGSHEGPKWLLLRRKGKFWQDDCYFILENYRRKEGEDDGEALAVCKFDTLDRDHYKFKKMDTYVDSDDSDYSSDSDSDVETELKQKTSWKMKMRCKFYRDRERKMHTYTLGVKAKGKARRDIKFVTSTVEDADGNRREVTRAEVSQKKKLKKFFYQLRREPGAYLPATLPEATALGAGAGAGAGAGGGPGEWAASYGAVAVTMNPVAAVSESSGMEIPLVCLRRKKNAFYATDLEWDSPMFHVKVHGNHGSYKPEIETKASHDPAAACLIGMVVSLELAPEDLVENLNPPWPRVFGPNGCSA